MDTSIKCSVCKDPDTLENSIVVCQICSVSVHKFCYGNETPDENFKCSPCLSGKENPVCKLCSQGGSAFKKTVCGGWIHVICALFTGDVIFEDINRMEPINISNLLDSKRNRTCSFCSKNVGFCCLCSQTKCKNRIHITCAQNKDCLKEISSPSDNSIKFRAYCLDHKPFDSSRRISSGFVNVIVGKKHKEKKKQSTKERRKEQANGSNKENIPERTPKKNQ